MGLWGMKTKVIGLNVHVQVKLSAENVMFGTLALCSLPLSPTSAL